MICDLYFSGTDRLAVAGFMVHTCISKCNRDGSKNNKIQNVVEMQTWNLSKNLHDPIFGQKDLHTKSAKISTIFTKKETA